MHLGLVIVMTVIESFATICMERGIYFYTHERLAFSDPANLGMALVFGLAYAGGAAVSHRASNRLGEKRLLILTLLGQLAVHLALAARPTAGGVVGGLVLIGLFNGLKWPVIESYVCAGRTPRQAARAVGMFNMAWAGAIPAALLVVGPLIAHWGPALFLLPAALNAVSLALAGPMRAPVHLAHDHPERPDSAQLPRLAALLVTSRALMLASYASMWVLAALMPSLFSAMGYGVSAASGLSGVLDLTRLAAFVLLGTWHGWHGRTGLLMLSLVGLPAGFFLVLFGPNLAVVLGGQVLFGLAAGACYNASLYYALVVKNASVEAGGGHEGLIGLGFAIGPAAGLVGVMLAGVLGRELYGMLVGIGPVFAACSAVALWALRRRTGTGREK